MDLTIKILLVLVGINLVFSYFELFRNAPARRKWESAMNDLLISVSQYLRSMRYTKDQFESAYAKKSGITVEELHKHDQYAVPCDCGEEDCPGWKMMTFPKVELKKLSGRCERCGQLFSNCFCKEPRR